MLTVSRSRSSVPGKGIVEGSTKNGKSREVYLTSDLRGILLAYKRRKQMEADKQRRKLSPYLFTDEHGQLIHPDTFTKRLRKIYDAIGFPREYHLHTLRHYFVTSLQHCAWTSRRWQTSWVMRTPAFWSAPTATPAGAEGAGG